MGALLRTKLMIAKAAHISTMVYRRCPRARRHILVACLLFAVTLALLQNTSRYVMPDCTTRWHLFGSSTAGRTQLYACGVDTLSHEGTARNWIVSPQLRCQSDDDGRNYSDRRLFLKALQRYATFHREEGSREIRTLLWRCVMKPTCGGLADRLKSITFSLLLAMITQRRLSIAWPQVGKQAFLHHNVINWNHINETVDREYILRSVFRGKFGLSMDPSSVHSMLETLADKETKTIALSSNLCPRSLLDRPPIRESKPISNGLHRLGLANFTILEVDALTGLAFRFLFNFDSKVIVEVNQAREVLGLRKGERYTAVHIRSGFMGMPGKMQERRHPKLMSQSEDWMRTLQCAVKVSDRLLGASSSLFLATDSFFIKQLAVEKFGSRIRTLNNSLIHIGLRQRPPNSTNADEVEGHLTLWVEFILLAEASVQVRGASGLPAIAGHVCSIPSSRVFNGIRCTSQKDEPAGCTTINWSEWSASQSQKNIKQ